MLKLFKMAFGITSNNIILATPLVLFMLLVSMYLGFSRNTVDSLPEIVISCFTLLFMFAAFGSAWFYSVKKAVDYSKLIFILDKDQQKVSNILKEIPTGMATYFLPFLGIIFLFIIILALWGALVFHIGQTFIGGLELDSTQLTKPISNVRELEIFIDSLTPYQVAKLGLWSAFIFVSNTIFSFVLMFWLPEFFHSVSKNPFITLFSSIKKVFVRFIPSFILFLYVGFLNFILSFVNTFAILNPISYFIMMIVYFYFLVYLVVLIFLYYDKEFGSETKE